MVTVELGSKYATASCAAAAATCCVESTPDTIFNILISAENDQGSAPPPPPPAAARRAASSEARASARARSVASGLSTSIHVAPPSKSYSAGVNCSLPTRTLTGVSKTRERRLKHTQGRKQGSCCHLALGSRAAGRGAARRGGGGGEEEDQGRCGAALPHMYVPGSAPQAAFTERKSLIGPPLTVAAHASPRARWAGVGVGAREDRDQGQERVPASPPWPRLGPGRALPWPAAAAALHANCPTGGEA